MPTIPVTEHEWTVHSINIHGVFFERWCQRVVSEARGWSLDATNYSVEFPPPNGPLRGKESALDVRASTGDSFGRLCLLIESKKNNLEFINWVFFPKFKAPRDRFNVSQVMNKRLEAPSKGWVTSTSVRTQQSRVPVADEGRETKGSYSERKGGDKTKTSNKAIQDAAYQVALATQAIVLEDSSVADRLGRTGIDLPWERKTYVPAIVTTAKLFVCDFDPGDVNPVTGEVPFAKANLTEARRLVFEYALPRHLQFGPTEGSTAAYGEGLVDTFTRMHILVIQSEHFAGALKDLTGGDLSRF